MFIKTRRAALAVFVLIAAKVIILSLLGVRLIVYAMSSKAPHAAPVGTLLIVFCFLAAPRAVGWLELKLDEIRRRNESAEADDFWKNVEKICGR